MAEKKKHITREELEAYHSKKLSAAEMHALEKRALESSFEMEALEGLDEIDAMLFSKDLAELDRKLKTKSNKTFWSYTFRIAASLLLLIVASSLIYLLITKPELKEGGISMLDESVLDSTAQLDAANEAETEDDIDAFPIRDASPIQVDKISELQASEQKSDAIKIQSEQIVVAETNKFLATQEEIPVAEKELVSAKRTASPASGMAQAMMADNLSSVSDSKLELLSNYLSGSFSSTAQATADSNFFDVHLNVVRIWPTRPDGIWLYVEQAAANSLNNPYRQRIYHLYQAGDNYVSAIYTIANQEAVIGGYKQAQHFESLTLNDVELKAGCEVYLKYNNNHFEGETGNKTCPSDLRGAAYTTSKVWLSANEMRSWDQGFNNEGLQVWGSTAGPYIFKRK
jgi:CpeT protein